MSVAGWQVWLKFFGWAYDKGAKMADELAKRHPSDN